ncbi:hypothetical protein SLEP1_g54271 [Rubroshorea leprosula]|uniref:Integrase catalytic domain-containing protein n=1 Tax=Rubroshorea leprosula TaxID=152421 RepID=A0AAV5MEU4_9ROSI|nr:hypothetical protein SLEP1_g54271 [Rubroshorea leprosula]
MVNTRSVRAGNPSLPLGQAHNLTSTANQDVVAAQLVAMQQQFGVFQLVLAQLLARNNPGDPLINLLNPAQQPPTPQQNPQPVQHAPALSESQGQSHIAPAQQPLPDDVTQRLDSLEKLIPQLETYDGTKDPDDHLHAFYSCMQAQNASDALMCKIFPSTLRGNARTWYYSLPPRSISSYTEMASAFATKFSSRRFRDSLIKHPATTFSEVNDRSLKFITAEEYALSQNPTPSKNQNPDWRDKNSSRKRMRVAQNRGPMSTSTPRFERPKSAPPQQSTGKPLCNSLRSELESLAQKGMLNEYIHRAQQPRFVREQGPQPQGNRNPPNRQGVGHQQAPPPLPPPARIIHMITGGLKAGTKNVQLTKVEGPNLAFNQQRKLYVREVKHQNRAQKRKFDDAEWKNQPITFTPADFDTVVTPHNDPLVTSVMINNCEVQRVLVDTGSAPDIMYFHCFESLGLNPALLQRYDGPIYGFNNQPVPVEGVLTLNVAFGSGRNYVTPSVRFLVVKMPSSFNVVIGRPTLTEIRAVVSQSHLCLKFPTPMGIATLRGNQEVARHCYITSVTRPQKDKDQTPEANPQRIPNDQQVMGVEIVDNRPEDVTRAAPVEDVEEVPIDDRDPSRKTQIGTRLSTEERAELIAFLHANNDVFAWTSADMPGIPPSVSQHKLSTYSLKRPVPQKRRLFGGERLQAIKEEVEKLLQAGFVRKVDYCEWVANPVLVKKANAYGNEILSLLDSYSGYHQNVGATYQKMVTIVFRVQIGRNLEVYFDDIVVKSLKAEDHLADLEETFNNLRKNKIRLNPAKCIFGVESRKFLSFMVSRRGIEVNPEKIRAIAEMKPPKSVKDIQRLTGRVAALHRFISKSADKCLPFFKIMRSAAQKHESGKQKKFEWNQDCQAAFEELKSYLSSPPLLTKAIDGEILYLYLGISDEAISSVLVREEAKQLKPIYYISSVLHGAELRYPIAEKAALAIVTSARKLRPYFQSHPIIVLTYQPLRQILQKPECSGKLIKWVVELREFEITFQHRSAIRAQTLVDFIVECTPYGYRSEHALKFNFDATNNMTEYEALLLGLQLALELKADSLFKFASDSSLSSRSVFVEVLDEPSFMKPRMMEISTDPDTPSWTDSIISFLQDGTVPKDKKEAMRLRKKASRYTLVDGVLYKRSFSLPLLRCLNPYEAEYALREVHEGVCGSHVGARTLAHKVLRQGYYWPNMYKDATHFVQKCSMCQFFAHLTHQPVEELTNLVAPWPFAQWGLDLLGPFVKGVGDVTHLIVGVDYFTKWVEARPLSSLTSKKVEDFVFSSIICRYGIPNQIVADNGTQFNCSSFRDFCSSYGIKLQFISVYHPESNGMVESVNKCILEGIKPRLEQHKAKWVDELNNVL